MERKMTRFTLVSHHLCPYVQRAAIALAEKGVTFDRAYVDLADKPAWFTAISPLGKVPLLIVREQGGRESVIFESAVILEYLEEVLPDPLHPADPLGRARARGWVEFGSAILNRIGRFYSARGESDLELEAQALAEMFGRVEAELGTGPWFAGQDFTLVDAVFGPVFRYFDVIDRIGDFGILDGKPKLARWRLALAGRPSVQRAVTSDYPDRLKAFFRAKDSALAGRMRQAA
jgi:glutathione S-transferase